MDIQSIKTSAKQLKRNIAKLKKKNSKSENSRKELQSLMPSGSRKSQNPAGRRR
jgi:hypothetical protein